MNMSVETAYHKSIETVIKWISKEIDTDKTQVIFRSFSPVHFRFTIVFVSCRHGIMCGSGRLGQNGFWSAQNFFGLNFSI